MSKSAKEKNASTGDAPNNPHHRKDYAIYFPEPSRTKQSFRDETDVNRIMARYMQTGMISHLNPREPNYGVAPSIDFREAMEIVRNTQTQFMELPASIREQVNNDPAQFLEFVENASEDDMRDMGLLDPTQVGMDQYMRDIVTEAATEALTRIPESTKTPDPETE